MLNLDDIVALYHDLRDSYGPEKDMARRVSEAFGNRIALPLPEMARHEQLAVANLMAQGIEGHGQRIGSLMPEVHWPALRPGFKRSEEYADVRRRANLGWLEANAYDVKMGLRGRWYVAYAMSPVVVRWDSRRGIPKWELRDPLTAYPADTGDITDVDPPFAVFAFTRNLKWLRKHYPDHIAKLELGVDPKPSDRYDLLEYVDSEQVTLAVCGKRKDPWDPGPPRDAQVLLETVPNRAGTCLVACPGRIGLDGRMGAYDRQLGMFQMRAKLMALQLIAVKRGVLPEQWAVYGDTKGKIITVADAQQGTIGEIQGGKMEVVRPDPSFANLQAIAQLERSERMEGDVPADFTGESASNSRTGRRSEVIMQNTVGYAVEEAQKHFARSLTHENRIAVAVAKAYGGDAPKSFFVSWKGAKGHVDYTPNLHFETDANTAEYAFAGMDASTLTVTGGQLVGMRAMSRRRYMELHPLIDDVERELDEIATEAIDDAAFAALAQMASSDPSFLVHLARIKELVRTDQMDWHEALLTVQREQQEAQAAPAPPEAPEAQPGIAGQPTIPPPPASVTNLSNMLQALRSA